MSPRIITVNESSDVSLSCSAVGNPLPKIYWKTADILTTINVSVEPNRTHVLRMFNLTAHNNGWITCVADNLAGKAEMRARLIIEGTNPCTQNLLQYLII